MNFYKLVHSGWSTQLHRLFATVNKMGGGGEISKRKPRSRKENLNQLNLNVEFFSHCSEGHTAVTAGSVACISFIVSLVIIQPRLGP